MSEETKDLNVVQVDSLDKVRLRFRTELFQRCFISILQKDYSLSTQDARKYFSDAVSGDANFARQIAGGIMSEYKPLEEAIWKMIENFGQGQTENMDPVTIEVFRTAMENAVRSGLRIAYMTWHIRNQVSINSISGLPNKEAGNKMLEGLVAKNVPFSFAFFDLDNLGSLNTAFGHEDTNALLKSLGERLKTGVRTNEPAGKNDSVIHAHGDEFYLILNGANVNDGMIAAEKLLKLVNSEPFNLTLSENQLQRLKEKHLSIKNKISELLCKPESEQNDLTKLRSGLVVLEKCLDSLDSTDVFISQRREELGMKKYNLKISLTASIGVCNFEPDFNRQEKLTEQEIKEICGQILRIAQNRSDESKRRGRNCVTGN